MKQLLLLSFIMLLSCNSRKTATKIQTAELIGEQKIWVDDEKKESEETQKIKQTNQSENNNTQKSTEKQSETAQKSTEKQKQTKSTTINEYYPNGQLKKAITRIEEMDKVIDNEVKKNEILSNIIIEQKSLIQSQKNEINAVNEVLEKTKIKAENEQEISVKNKDKETEKKADATMYMIAGMGILGVFLIAIFVERIKFKL